MDLMVNLLIDGLRHQFQQMPWPHSDGNAQFSFDEIGMAASSVFFVQSPSFLDHQRKFYEAHNRGACQSFLACDTFPPTTISANNSMASPVNRLWSDNQNKTQRLTQVPGIGVLNATALVATLGNAKLFRNGRHLSAFFGLVPKQNSSGGKQYLGGISKHGDAYLHQLLVHGARALCTKRTLESKDRCPAKLKRLLVDKK